MRKYLKYMIVVAMVALFVGPGFAATYFTDDFGSGWNINDEPGRGGSPNGTTDLFDLDGDSVSELRIRADADGTAQDAIWAGAGSDLLAAENTDLNTYFSDPSGARAGFVTFDFWADSGGGNPSPGSLSFYIKDDSTMWRYNIYQSGDTDMALGRNSYFVSLYGGAGWENAYGSASFADVFDSVDEIGIVLGYTTENGQVYGLDNFQLHNPEPGTYAVLAFALVSLGVTFRGKLQSGLKGLLRK